MSIETQTALGLTESRKWWNRTIKWALYALILFIFTVPLVTILVGAFSTMSDPTKLSLVPIEPTLDNFKAAGRLDVYRYLLNSFIVVGFGLALQMLVSVFAAYSLARKKFIGMAAVMLIILATMMLPDEIIAIPLTLVLADLPLLHFSLMNTLAGMIVPVGMWGFSILVMTEFMRDVPLELEESARIDGAGDFRIFWQIVLPMCKPALGVIGVFGFTMVWDQYLIPLLVAQQPENWTLSLALRALRGDPNIPGIGLLLASALLALVPSVIVFLLFQRSFASGLTTGALKG